MDGADARRVGRDRAVEHELVADRAGPRYGRADPGVARDVGCDRRAAFVRLVLETMLASFMPRDDRHVERVRLVHGRVAAQVFALRREVDAIDLAAEPAKL